MIIEIPDKDDFFQEGFGMLNLAWDAIANLFDDLNFPDCVWDGVETEG